MDITFGSGDTVGQKRDFRGFSGFRPFLTPIISEDRIQKSVKFHSSTRLIMVYNRLVQHFSIWTIVSKLRGYEVDRLSIFRKTAKTAFGVIAVTRKRYEVSKFW